MRVTNQMTSNQLLLNLNKSMNTLNFLQYQSMTGNKIRYASDNPIIAGRSLKFRTNIVETEQYISNVSQGKSWLETSGYAVKNVMEALVNSGETSIRSLLVKAGGVNTVEDSKIYANQLRETLNEILGEINTSYAGRYVFSGFKTDQKPVFDAAYTAKNPPMTITQTFSFDEIQTDYKVYDKINDSNVYSETAMPSEISCYRIKLAYDEGITGITSISGITVNSVSSTDPDAYNPSADINFIKETGELIFSQAAYNTLSPTLPIDITYQKDSFNAGDLNPKAYFKCVEDGQTSEIDGQFIMYEFGINNKMQVNSLAKDILTTGLINDIKDAISLIEGVKLSDSEKLITEFMAGPPAISREQAEERAKQQLDDENKFYTSMLGDKFTQLIGKLDKHGTYLSQENTSIGARVVRLDLIENRLQDDRINYEDLKSENDYVNAEEAYIRFSSMLAVYQSALKTGANVIQMSLVNYI